MFHPTLCPSAHSPNDLTGQEKAGKGKSRKKKKVTEGGIKISHVLPMRIEDLLKIKEKKKTNLNFFYWERQTVCRMNYPKNQVSIGTNRGIVPICTYNIQCENLVFKNSLCSWWFPFIQEKIGKYRIPEKEGRNWEKRWG